MRATTAPDQHMTDVEFLTKPRGEARPDGSFNESNDFDEAAFDEYTRMVLECTQVAEETESVDVQEEGPSMIKKMRGLLHPSVKLEVDYEVAVKDVSNVLFMWKMNAAAGSRAFIPNI